jgi:hypothetical protein
LVDAIAAGTATRATCERRIAKEAECAKMERELSHLETRARSVIELHPRAIARYQERVAALTETLRGGNPEREAAIAILRSLVDRTTSHRCRHALRWRLPLTA